MVLKMKLLFMHDWSVFNSSIIKLQLRKYVMINMNQTPLSQITLSIKTTIVYFSAIYTEVYTLFYIANEHLVDMFSLAIILTYLIYTLCTIIITHCSLFSVNYLRYSLIQLLCIHMTQ